MNPDLKSNCMVEAGRVKKMGLDSVLHIGVKVIPYQAQHFDQGTIQRDTLSLNSGTAL